MASCFIRIRREGLDGKEEKKKVFDTIWQRIPRLGSWVRIYNKQYLRLFLSDSSPAAAAEVESGTHEGLQPQSPLAMVPVETLKRIKPLLFLFLLWPKKIKMKTWNKRRRRRKLTFDLL